MKTFAYTSRGRDGRLKKGTVLAADRAGAMREVKAAGGVPLSVAEARSGTGGGSPAGRRVLLWALLLVPVALAALWFLRPMAKDGSVPSAGGGGKPLSTLNPAQASPADALAVRQERENPPAAEKLTMASWGSVFSNKAYKNLLGIFLPFQIAVDLVLALFIFYIDIVVLQYKNYELVVGTLLVCSMLLMAVQGKLAEKKGKAFPLYIGIPIWIISTIIFIWIDASVPLIFLCILAALIAVGSSAGNLSSWSMLADIYDIDEIRSGKRREGLYAGVTTFLRKFASGIAILLMGFGLQAMGFDQNEYSILKASVGDFDPAVYAQSNVVSGIKWMFIIIPVIFLTVCLFFALKNNISKRRFDAVLKGIEEFKTKGNIDALTEQETSDVLLITGMEKKALWGGKS